MKRRLRLLGWIVLAAALAQAPTVEARWCRRPAPDRGVAILSPLESPDPCDSPVGGTYKIVPYYGGYLWDPCCFPPMYGPVTSYAPTGPGLGKGALGARPAPYREAGYGGFSGASRDEANLLHLGGFGPSANGYYRPHPGNGDIIDRIEGGR